MSSYCAVCRGLFNEPHRHSAPDVPTRRSSPRRATPLATPRGSSRRPVPSPLRRTPRDSLSTSAAERDTLSALLSMSPSLPGSTLLVRTPSRASQLRRGAHMRKGKTHERVERRLDNLQETLERIRDAVHRDNAEAIDIKSPGKDEGPMGIDEVDDVHEDKEDDFVKKAVYYNGDPSAWGHNHSHNYSHSHNNNSNSGEGFEVQYTVDDGAPAQRSAEDTALTSLLGRRMSQSDGATHVAPLLTPLHVTSVPKQPSSPHAQHILSFMESADSLTPIRLSGEEAPAHSDAYGRGAPMCRGPYGGGESIAHVEVLREGFVELCAAVREDLNALHARVSRLQRDTRRILSPSQLHCPQPPLQAPSASPAPVAQQDQPLFLSSPHTYGELLAELQQYSLSAVHKALQQQQQQQQHERWASPFDAQATDMSPGSFDERVRSVVRSVLRGDHNDVDGDVAAELRLLCERTSNAAAHTQQQCERRTRLAFRRQCAALEEQLDALSAAVRSIRADVDKIQSRPSVPMPSLITEAAAAPVGAEGAEEKIMRRVNALFADVEERCVRRVREELMQPILEHVRRLMAAHQAMIDSVVESRCAQFEKNVARGRQSWDVEVADLRSRVGSLRGDVHRALRDLSGNLNVACPGF